MRRLKKYKKMCTRKKELENIENDGRGENDRLSLLPDNLLISILSFIPFSSAVATSVLSHRWRHLWTYLTHISFNFSWSYEDSLHKFQNSITTINHVISKLTSHKIHTFHLHLPSYRAEEQVCSTLLVPMVDEICLRNPEVINIVLNNYSNYLCYLSTSLFKTHSLVELRLGSSFKFNFVTDAQIAINMPYLKILDMSLCDSHRRLMHTLFKSCPLLERLCLCLTLEEDDHHVNIIAPNLKFLTVKSSSSNYLLLVDAPKLVNLKTLGFSSSVIYHFTKNLRCLQDVEVLIPEYHGGDVNDYHSRMLALFQGISCTRSLTFRQCFHNHLLDASMPSFPNLVELSFDGWDLDSRSCMPSCLLSNVKIVEIFDMKPNDYGIRVLRDILSNATVLEQLQVSHVDYHGDEPLQDRLWDEYEFAMKLFELPRSSSSCQINLSGEMITVSSKDYRDGQLNCKLPNRIT